MSYTKKHRPLFDIAIEIFEDWKKMSPTARPYADAMLSLNQIDERYGLDSAKSIVAYFLSNAGYWRGEVARRVKKELKEISGV